MSARWQSPDDGDLDLAPMRGCIAGVVASVSLIIIAVVVLVLLLGCAPSSPSPLPSVTGSSSSAASSTTSELEAAFDRWWVEARHGCGEQTALVVDDLAARAVDELDAPALDARLAASDYVRRHCPR